MAQSITVEDRGERIAVVFHDQQREIAFVKSANPSVVREAVINEALPGLQQIMDAVIDMMASAPRTGTGVRQ